MIAAVINCAGRGERFGSSLPKQFVSISGIPIYIMTLRAFEHCPLINRIFVTAEKEFESRIKSDCQTFGITKFSGVLCGGSTAQLSRYYALRELVQIQDNDDIVVMHDAVRPFVSVDTIEEEIALFRTGKYKGVTSVTRHNAPILASANSTEAHIVSEKNRGILMAHTPFVSNLGFLYSKYHEQFINDTLSNTVGMDDACFNGNQNYGYKEISLRESIKITTKEDIQFFQ